MAKTDNPILGKTDCTACGGTAHIKRRSNGRNLLYIHCPKCGTDQRSGHLMQDKLEKIVKGEAAAPQTIPKSQPKSDEWHPTLMNESGNKTEHSPKTPANKPKINDDNTEQSDLSIGKIAVGILACVGVLFGLKLAN